MENQQNANEEPKNTRGVVCALSAYAIWGVLMPLYMKALGHIPAAEIVIHRILWALPCALVVVIWQKRFSGLRRIISNPRNLIVATASALLIATNWATYVYAIVSDQTLDAALGYYLNPLVNILLAAIFLRERPTPRQGLAITLAAIGVAVMTFKTDGLPWIALVVAGSFGTYGLLRKTMTVEASEGFFLEVAFLIPFALVALCFLPEGSHFFSRPENLLLLVGAGPITAAPLILYASGARRLRFTTVGLLQFSVPTLLFLVAVLVFKEPFDSGKLIAFAFIWSGVLLYAATLLRARKR
jgi:chloramphenicol-sensitive protein RarD